MQLFCFALLFSPFFLLPFPFPLFLPSFILLFLSPSLPSSLSLYIPSFLFSFSPLSLLSFHQAQEDTFALRHEETSLQFVLFDIFWTKKWSDKWNVKPCAPSRIQQALLWYQKRVTWKGFLSNWALKDSPAQLSHLKWIHKHSWWLALYFSRCFLKPPVLPYPGFQ